MRTYLLFCTLFLFGCEHFGPEPPPQTLEELLTVSDSEPSWKDKQQSYFLNDKCKGSVWCYQEWACDETRLPKQKTSLFKSRESAMRAYLKIDPACRHLYMKLASRALEEEGALTASE